MENPYYKTSEIFSSTPLQSLSRYEDQPVRYIQRNFEDILEEELQKSKEPEQILQKRKMSTHYLKRGQGTLCTKSPRPKSQMKISISHKSSSHIKTLKNLSKNDTKKMIFQEEPERTNFTPLDLYRIRREKWKIKEKNGTERKSFEKIIGKILEDDKEQEIQRLRREMQKMKEIFKKQEDEIGEFKKEIEELKQSNMKLLNENNRLKTRQNIKKGI